MLSDSSISYRSTRSKYYSVNLICVLAVVLCKLSLDFKIHCLALGSGKVSAVNFTASLLHAHSYLLLLPNAPVPHSAASS